MDGVLVGGFVGASLLDWPGRVCASLFTAGCNLRCPFCHNPELVPIRPFGNGPEEFLGLVSERLNFLDGVCVSGGEPCLQKDLMGLLKEIKRMGLGVKLDTNGTYPEVLEELLGLGLLDFVAMDVKAPWDLYPNLVGGSDVAHLVKRSLGLIRSSGVEYELRTTWVPALMTLDDLRGMRFMLGDDPRWVVQLFRPGGCLDPGLDHTPQPSRDDLLEALPGVNVRG